MSDRDAFDGEIERLFARPPVLADEEAFVEAVERRLNSGSRLRAGILTVAGVMGGFFAVRETLDAGLGGLAVVSQTSRDATQALDSFDFGRILDWLEAGGPDLAVSPAMPR